MPERCLYFAEYPTFPSFTWFLERIRIGKVGAILACHRNLMLTCLLALRGSQHLEFLLQNNLVKPAPSLLSDQAYTAGLLHKTRAESRAAPYPTQEEMVAVSNLVEKQTNGGEEDVMVLQRWNGKLIAERFELPEMEMEIERAVEQVEKGIKSKEELEEEKRELETATTGPAIEVSKSQPADAKKQQ